MMNSGWRNSSSYLRQLASSISVAVVVVLSAIDSGHARPIEYDIVAELWKKAKDPEKIINGVDADPRQYRWQAALLESAIANNYNAQFCGGALIFRRIVVTAAHCVIDLQGKDIQVLIAVERLDGSGGRLGVSQVILNAAYNDTTKENDIALVVLESATDEAPIPLIGQIQEEDVLKALPDIDIAGWGLTDQFRAGSKSTTLKEAQIPLQSRDVCNKLDAMNGRVLEKMICAGEYAGGADSCTGDSGGPLTYGSGAARVLVGIVSAGDGCGKPKRYGIYTRIAQYQDWIMEGVRPFLVDGQ